MIAPGTYRAKAVQWVLGESKSGVEQVAVDCSLLDENDAENARITWYGYFSEKAWERTVESLRLFGWTGADPTDLTGLDKNVVELVVEHEEWEGKTRAKAKWVNAPGGGLAMVAPLAGEKSKAFGARMKALIANKEKGSTPPAAAKKTAPKKTPNEDGDIAF